MKRSSTERQTWHAVYRTQCTVICVESFCLMMTRKYPYIYKKLRVVYRNETLLPDIRKLVFGSQQFLMNASLELGEFMARYLSVPV